MYSRVIMPPLRELPNYSVFMFDTKDSVSCISINVRILKSQNRVRRELTHDLVKMGIANGFIRRNSSTEVEVLVVVPNNPRINLNMIADYFSVKWMVVKADYRVEYNNTSNIHFLRSTLKVYKSTIEDPQCKSPDVDFDICSFDGFSVTSDN
jgi:hypothetical protein